LNIVKDTQRYEQFIRKNIPLVESDLLLKHKKMGQSRFAFLRATYYRWAQNFSKTLPDLAKAQHITAIGDIHLENFGTFRDNDEQLVWGINDFDEVDKMPYTNDLVRLATSALIAIYESRLRIRPKKACEIILDGYRDGLGGKGIIFIIKGRNHFLRRAYKEFSKDPRTWWKEMTELPLTDPTKLDISALELLNKSLPASKWHVTLHIRVAGLGSLGHRRFLAIGTSIKNKKREKEAYELKELGPPATSWRDGMPHDFSLMKKIRTDDPSRKINKTWIIRRLAPDCIKLEFNSLPSKKKEEHLLHMMGQELSNIHLKNSGMAFQILEDLDDRKNSWLFHAAFKMAKLADRDWNSWKNSHYFRHVSD